MSDSKKYNSIVFLTTLSVYLGLVLVGGAGSPVLAQAALTRNFDIQEELEYKDDLDKNPEDEKIDFAKSLDDYLKDTGDFIKDLRKLYQIEKFDLNYDKFEFLELSFVPCNVDGDPVRRAETTQRIDNHWLEPAIRDAKHSFESWDFLSDCLKDDKFKTGVSTSSNLKLLYDKSNLKIEVSAFKSDQQRASWLAEKLNQSLINYEFVEDVNFNKQLHKFTLIKAENNQIFIITNLPRASLDSLFAEKDAN